ncbi:PQQ-dependent sugar dehydrogenase [Nesterenkonia sandarakina]|uniref:Glucose/arabinose dehydrogenase n=1 Tax=Nesterenkonia sandarakina TaxID=272918 RepID=A0A2T0YKF4_9MICC|nr:PQQ-dependent sugar dehydrogenase [Nesterenkonia sandarakina]PRZ15687.1 glucose/arabinose dehydrogenase [Nesterenkonia sandarakina]
MGRLPVISAGILASLLLVSCADSTEGQTGGGEDAASDASADTTADASADATDTGEAGETGESGSATEDAAGSEPADEPSDSPESPDPDGAPFTITEQGSYAAPWALEFLPGTEQMLITSRYGELFLRSTTEADAAEDISVAGLPEDIVVDGQGGLGDVVAAPDFEESQRVYLSWINSSEAGTGAVVGHATLVDSGDSAALKDLTVIWEQDPKTSGSGHFSHRLAFSPDGEHLYVTSGDRQQLDPAQDLSSGLGKVMRLTPEGDPAPENPFAEDGDVTEEIWTYGHRNPLGIDFDADGQLWVSEMGPEGGDELNLLEAGENYGWPEASNGSQYGGAEIPDHIEGDGFAPPAAWWTPSISPGSLMIYQGEMFQGWAGSAFLGALSGEALVRVELDGDQAGAEEIWEMGARIRDVEQAPDGSIWIIEDGDSAELLRLTPPE